VAIAALSKTLADRHKRNKARTHGNWPRKKGMGENSPILGRWAWKTGEKKFSQGRRSLKTKGEGRERGKKGEGKRCLGEGGRGVGGEVIPG